MINMLYPQSMTSGMSDEDRQMLLMRAMLGAGAGMLQGAGQGMTTGQGIGAGMTAGMESMDQMMSAILKQKMAQNDMQLKRENLQLSRDRNQMLREDADRKAKMTGLTYDVQIKNGVPVMVTKNRDGQVVDVRPISGEAARMAALTNQGNNNQTPAADTPPAETDTGPGFWDKAAESVTGFMRGLMPTPDPVDRTPSITQGSSLIGTPRMTLTNEPLNLDSVVQAMQGGGAPQQSGLPSSFGSLNPVAQKQLAAMYKRQGKLSEEDEKYLIGIGAL